MKTNGFCTSSLSIARIKTRTKSNLGRKVDLWLTILHHSPSMREVRAETVEGTRKQSLKEGHGGVMFTVLLYGLLSRLLSYVIQDQLLRGGTAHSGLSPITLPLIKKMFCAYSRCHEWFWSPLGLPRAINSEWGPWNSSISVSQNYTGQSNSEGQHPPPGRILVSEEGQSDISSSAVPLIQLQND